MKKFNRPRPPRDGQGFGRPQRERPRDERSAGQGGDANRGFARKGPQERFSGGFRRGGSTPWQKPEMHKAVCAKCNQRCEVPFRPSASKPVYCSECYQKDDTKKRPRQMSEQLDEINVKLDKILRALHLAGSD